MQGSADDVANRELSIGDPTGEWTVLNTDGKHIIHILEIILTPPEEAKIFQHGPDFVNFAALSCKGKFRFSRAKIKHPTHPFSTQIIKICLYHAVS